MRTAGLRIAAMPYNSLKTAIGGLEDTLPEERETSPPIALAEVVDEMKTIDDLHRVGGSLADAIRIQGAAIATDDGDRRMLHEPGRYAGG